MSDRFPRPTLDTLHVDDRALHACSALIWLQSIRRRLSGDTPALYPTLKKFWDYGVMSRNGAHTPMIRGRASRIMVDEPLAMRIRKAP